MSLRDRLLQPFVNAMLAPPQLAEFESRPCASRHVTDWLPATARALYRSLTGDAAFTTGWYSVAQSDDSVRITRSGDSVIVEAKVAGETTGSAALDLSDIADAAILADVEKAVWTAIENARPSNRQGSGHLSGRMPCPPVPLDRFPAGASSLRPGGTRAAARGKFAASTGRRATCFPIRRVTVEPEPQSSY